MGTGWAVAEMPGLCLPWTPICRTSGHICSHVGSLYDVCCMTMSGHVYVSTCVLVTLVYVIPGTPGICLHVGSSRDASGMSVAQLWPQKCLRGMLVSVWLLSELPFKSQLGHVWCLSEVWDPGSLWKMPETLWESCVRQVLGYGWVTSGQRL